MAAFLTQYELEREDRIAANKRRLQEMGVSDAKDAFDDASQKAALAQAPKRQKRKTPLAPIEPQEIRRSGRDRPKVDYREESGNFHDRVPGVKGERKVVYMNREDLDASLFASPKIRSNVDSGKGVRIQGGRVYDSKLGVTCHWCRQKTLENKVTCTDERCGGGRRLPTSFCKMCLKNRHGEDVEQAEASGRWVCPCCRGSCGRGCVSCCNCGPCRKKNNLEPTRQIIKEARESGFDNVHDYLVHQKTGESAADIAQRKVNASWGVWLSADAECEADADAPGNEQDDNAAGPVIAKQQQLTTTFQAVKDPSTTPTHAGDSAKSTAARKAERKNRIMMSMGLGLNPPVPVVA